MCNLCEDVVFNPLAAGYTFNHFSCTRNGFTHSEPSMSFDKSLLKLTSGFVIQLIRVRDMVFRNGRIYTFVPS